MESFLLICRTSTEPPYHIYGLTTREHALQLICERLRALTPQFCEDEEVNDINLRGLDI